MPVLSHQGDGCDQRWATMPLHPVMSTFALAAGIRSHPHERDRLDSLASYAVLDSPPEAAYDALTALAARLCDAPIVAVSLVDADRGWFKSVYGWALTETPREISFSSDVVTSGTVMVVTDAAAAERYCDNPYVVGDPQIRSYLGVPLVGRDGLPLGALCVIDRRVRNFTAEQVGVLTTLADQVMFLLEQRRRDHDDGLFDGGMLHEARDPLQLRAALQGGQLVPYYQPLVDIRTGRVHQLEALLRWEHPKQGTLTPESFFPAIEASALVVPVGRAVLDEALDQLAALRVQRIRLPDGMAINVASGQLGRPGLARDVLAALDRHRLPGDQLTLEITEATALANPAVALAELEALTAMGVHIVIDDFGVGWSNLSRILELPINGVKIDRSIAARVLDDPRAAAMVRSTVLLCGDLGLEVTAEGIETTAVRDHLADAGARWAQGWLYSPAVSESDLSPLLRRLNNSPAVRGIHTAPRRSLPGG